MCFTFVAIALSPSPPHPPPTSLFCVRSDLAAYLAVQNLPLPQITRVPVLGGCTIANCPAESGEMILDVSTIAGMAPGAAIRGEEEGGTGKMRREMFLRRRSPRLLVSPSPFSSPFSFFLFLSFQSTRYLHSAMQACLQAWRR